jgi:hypothetical protein
MEKTVEAAAVLLINFLLCMIGDGLEIDFGRYKKMGKLNKKSPCSKVSI